MNRIDLCKKESDNSYSRAKELRAKNSPESGIKNDALKLDISHELLKFSRCRQQMSFYNVGKLYVLYIELITTVFRFIVYCRLLSVLYRNISAYRAGQRYLWR